MKREITVAFLLCVLVRTSAQDVKIRAGFFYSADLCYRTIEVTADHIEFIKESRTKREVPQWGFTTGISVMKSFSKNMFLQTGISYSRKGYADRKMQVQYGDMIDPRFGFIYLTQSAGTTRYVKSYYNFYYLECPVKICFIARNTKLKPFAGIGFTAGILISSSRKFVKIDNKNLKESNTRVLAGEFNTFNFFPTASFGFEHDFEEQLTVRIEVNGEYGLNKIIDAPITDYLWNAGIGAGLFWNFRKK